MKANKENDASYDDNRPADTKMVKEIAKAEEQPKRKAKKRVGFAAQSDEVVTFEKDEAPEINLASIVNRSGSRTAALIPVSPIVTKRKTNTSIIEEELEWDEDDDDSACFSLHDLQGEVKITRDTERMTLPELRRELQERGKSTAGTKNDLVKRLNTALKRAKDVVCMDD
jgi:hypothetical protein